MIGNLEPEESVLSAIEKLGWKDDDDISVEIAGSQTCGIEGTGTKWSPKKGTKRYNTDAFIVIKNKTRNSTVPSQPNPELKQQHPYNGTLSN
jgi:hypothetical protein